MHGERIILKRRGRYEGDRAGWVGREGGGEKRTEGELSRVLPRKSSRFPSISRGGTHTGWLLPAGRFERRKTDAKWSDVAVDDDDIWNR